MTGEASGAHKPLGEGGIWPETELGGIHPRLQTHGDTEEATGGPGSWDAALEASRWAWVLTCEGGLLLRSPGASPQDLQGLQSPLGAASALAKGTLGDLAVGRTSRPCLRTRRQLGASKHVAGGSGEPEPGSQPQGDRLHRRPRDSVNRLTRALPAAHFTSYRPTAAASSGPA